MPPVSRGILLLVCPLPVPPSNTNILHLFILSVCAHTRLPACVQAHTRVCAIAGVWRSENNFLGVCFLLPPCGAQGLNLGLSGLAVSAFSALRHSSCWASDPFYFQHLNQVHPAPGPRLRFLQRLLALAARRLLLPFLPSRGRSD